MNGEIFYQFLKNNFNSFDKDTLVFEDDNISFILEVCITPGAKHDKIFLKEGILKIMITEQAIENKANVAVLEILSRIFGTAKSNIQIRSGFKTRNKKIKIILELKGQKNLSYYFKKIENIVKGGALYFLICFLYSTSLIGLPASAQAQVSIANEADTIKTYLISNKEEDKKIIELLKTLDKVETKEFPTQLKLVREGLVRYIEQKKNLCFGILNEKQRVKLTKEQKESCKKELKDYHSQYLEKVYESQKKYLVSVHQARLLQLDKLKNEASKGVF